VREITRCFAWGQTGRFGNETNRGRSRRGAAGGASDHRRPGGTSLAARLPSACPVARPWLREASPGTEPPLQQKRLQLSGTLGRISKASHARNADHRSGAAGGASAHRLPVARPWLRVRTPPAGGTSLAARGFARDRATATTDEAPALSALRSPLSGLRSQVSGLRSQVSGLRSQVSGLRSQVSGFRSPVSGFLSPSLTRLVLLRRRANLRRTGSRRR